MDGHTATLDAFAEQNEAVVAQRDERLRYQHPEVQARSAAEDRPVVITAPYDKPELFPDGLREGELDHFTGR